MGGMKSGTGDVWGSDDEDEDESVEDADVADASTERGAGERDAEERDGEPVAADSNASTDAPSASSSGDSGESRSKTTATSENDIATSSSSRGESASEGTTEGTSKDTTEGTSKDTTESGQPYVVRRMLKDKSVQFERDERLTFFVHDDVKTGEQELEAETQGRFGRDIPVFDIREAVYRAALQNREDVISELESMGYTRD
ncbi:hypothetical protein [Halorubellus litoreus]|uniref:Uncharacterized protein n=1 Tax=Halorubellus litoreus TaxID=755308 RepID=A0ABD5VGW1_9EURY